MIKIQAQESYTLTMGRDEIRAIFIAIGESDKRTYLNNADIWKASNDVYTAIGGVIGDDHD